jgi:DNA-binding NarL/FixJ family response regulator
VLLAEHAPSRRQRGFLQRNRGFVEPDPAVELGERVPELRIDGGLPFAEIATTLGISEGNAKSHFHYAVKRLRDEVRALSVPTNPGGSS